MGQCWTACMDQPRVGDPFRNLLEGLGGARMSIVNRSEVVIMAGLAGVNLIWYLEQGLTIAAGLALVCVIMAVKS